MVLGFVLGMLTGIVIALLGILFYIVESVKKYEYEETRLKEVK